MNTLTQVKSDEVTPEMILQECLALRQKKAKDYMAGNKSMADYYPFGSKSYLTMINTKMQRLLALEAAIDSGQAPNFEGMDDTVIDMINYCSFYAAFLKNQK